MSSDEPIIYDVEVVWEILETERAEASGEEDIPERSERAGSQKSPKLAFGSGKIYVVSESVHGGNGKPRLLRVEFPGMEIEDCRVPFGIHAADGP